MKMLTTALVIAGSIWWFATDHHISTASAAEPSKAPNSEQRPTSMPGSKVGKCIVTSDGRFCPMPDSEVTSELSYIAEKLEEKHGQKPNGTILAFRTSEGVPYLAVMSQHSKLKRGISLYKKVD